MKTVEQLKNLNIIILGAGLTGLSCARFLHNNKVAFTVNDSREKAVPEHEFNSEFGDNKLVQGHWDSALIKQADLVIVSPGIDTNQEELNAVLTDKEVVGDVELYFQLKQVPTLAVTGSNGKSTVVSLLNHIGEQLGENVQLSGNIGSPILDSFEQTVDALILELSSFQLETINSMQPQAATVLNVSDDHLDRHGSIDNYQVIKQKIYQNTEIAVVNRDDVRTQVPTNIQVEKVISIGCDKPETGQFGIEIIDNSSWLMFGSQALIQVSELPLSGVHNALNVMAALAMGQAMSWSLADMVSALSSFNGLPHRCQPVKSDDDILWINDSKATNVGAAIAAISGIAPTLNSQQKIYLIAGGDGKGADFSPLVTEIVEHVEQVYLLGKDAELINNQINNGNLVDSIEQAVEQIKHVAKAGDVVLLSPACASIDMFKNFAVRGQTFIDAVNNSNCEQGVSL